MLWYTFTLSYTKKTAPQRGAVFFGARGWGSGRDRKRRPPVPQGYLPLYPLARLADIGWRGRVCSEPTAAKRRRLGESQLKSRLSYIAAGLETKSKGGERQRRRLWQQTVRWSATEASPAPATAREARAAAGASAPGVWRIKRGG